MTKQENLPQASPFYGHEILNEYSSRDWHLYFAWHPVKLTSGKWIPFGRVYRKINHWCNLEWAEFDRTETLYQRFIMEL